MFSMKEVLYSLRATTLLNTPKALASQKEEIFPGQYLYR